MQQHKENWRTKSDTGSKLNNTIKCQIKHNGQLWCLCLMHMPSVNTKTAFCWQMIHSLVKFWTQLNFLKLDSAEARLFSALTLSAWQQQESKFSSCLAPTCLTGHPTRASTHPLLYIVVTIRRLHLPKSHTGAECTWCCWDLCRSESLKVFLHSITTLTRLPIQRAGGQWKRVQSS